MKNNHIQQFKIRTFVTLPIDEHIGIILLIYFLLRAKVRKFRVVCIAITVLFISCTSLTNKNIENYFELVNKSELLICKEDFKQALATYKLAFNEIEKPFGKDVYNAALCAQLTSNTSERNKYLQKIIDNSKNCEFTKSKFVGKYMSAEEWEKLAANKQIDYDTILHQVFLEIGQRDQLFRPMYDTHDDTIEAIRKANLNQILAFTNSKGYPSQIELGFSNYLRKQPHDIVLHHTAQRRSTDKTVTDLEPYLKKAVQGGRIDPELAISYMNFQDDDNKVPFQVYATWQYRHHLLPDSLNEKIWFPNLSEEQKLHINVKRKQWLGNSTNDIEQKTDYLSKSSLPFIFSSVVKNIGNLHDDLDKRTALEQYNMSIFQMVEYKNGQQ